MMAPRPLPGVLRTAPYVQGAARTEGHAQPIKLSSNESPLGPSPRAIEAFQQCAANLFRYPDGAQTELRAAISEVFHLERDRIVCGNGSDQLIELTIRAFVGAGDPVVLSQHSFVMARTHALVQGADVVIAPEPHYCVDVDAILERVTARTRIVVFASPNNPCGTYLPRSELHRLHAGLPRDTILLVDAAYADYVVAPDYDAGFDLARDNENVIVTRTFSKLYGLAGLRIGWAYAAPAIIATLDRIRTPFNCNCAALAAATAAVRDRAYAQKVCDHNVHWLAQMSEQLRALGLEVVPSVANFVLIRFPGGAPEAVAAHRHLLARGVIPRPLGSDGLNDCLRLTIGLEHENLAALAALRDFRATRG